MKKTRNIVIKIATASILFVVLFISACKKEAPVTIKTIIEHDTVQHAWQAEPTFNNRDQYITAAFSTGNGKVFFYGDQYNVYVYDSISKQWAVEFYGGSNLYQRPAVNKQFFVKIDNNGFFTIVNPYSDFTPVYGDSIKHLDTSFSFSPQYAYLPNTNTIDISDSNRIMFPAQTKNNAQNNGFYLVDAKQVNFNSNITLANFHKLFLGHVNGSGIFSTINHIKNRFFISIQDTVYLVREDYSVKTSVPNNIFYSVFQFGNNYFATTAGGSSNGNIYETSDNGETWALKYTTSIIGLVIINFDGKLIGIYNDQVWEVTIGATNISFKEIVNDGLTGKKITGLVKCNNKVWITTNGGVFYRPYANFYQYK